jgi:ribonuclease HI/transposase InsO family protein
MGRYPASSSSDPTGTLDHVFRRVVDETGAGAGLLFISPLGKHLRYGLRLHFSASNNVAEYEALVNGLRIAIELGVRRLDAHGDS